MLPSFLKEHLNSGEEDLYSPKRELSVMVSDIKGEMFNLPANY